MSITPNEEWIRKYNEKKGYLSPVSDFNEYFSKNELCNKKLFHLDMGEVTFPTGNILVRDPLVYLHQEESPYFTTVPTGTFPVTTLVAEVDEDHYRYVATRIKFTENKAVSHTEALIGNEDLDSLENGEYFGFNVDAGLATIVDTKTRDLYCNFVNQWEKENPEGNIYDNFFAQEFKNSYERNPEYQRTDGDWINFRLPGSNLSIPMIQTGFGDGVYPVYLGYDENGNICELVVQYIAVEIAFGEDE
ncbi:hypothetical protein BAX97_04695 [Elizabethkingia meningoseptica]|uniref:DUF4241 domain-containing protein n=1 Tax=Elizabethkingia meningoseptica TaxID=238 RepID=UPI000332D5AB|nr:DUF4241 domain-containing protein [Elizabethkingia meningoseptica]AQX06882.1 hypothetical protein BBD33_17155 [Elizabethkingia meningoseptica]AQX48928.1 hypothetical protein B5G46_17140 [Elizabethkingia meningoseptica]EOR28453.1 hypothetical protein L100_16260 [Elizabethkingia meningoseptica ATCC 13253 = NBRC 12535]KUY15014.1 hypothetical protein ATB99_10965 [Elizabethkingia meningoseptica]OPB69615.1 hypothetical protein BAY30_05645 [Elizabethkingia meningoseptica]